MPLLWFEEPIWVRWPCNQWIILVAVRTWQIWHSFMLGCVLFKGPRGLEARQYRQLWLLVCHFRLSAIFSQRFSIFLLLLLCCLEALGGRLGKTWNKLVENISNLANYQMQSNAMGREATTKNKHWHYLHFPNPCSPRSPLSLPSQMWTKLMAPETSLPPPPLGGVPVQPKLSSRCSLRPPTGTGRGAEAARALSAPHY